jgi:hypothetical protein
MDEKPKRRWFRFRLSTVLILTAIVAWGMATHPSIRCGAVQAVTWDGDEVNGVRVAILFDYMNRMIDEDAEPSDDILAYAEFDIHDEARFYWLALMPRKAIWPALALAAFLAWKAAWGVVESRRRKPGAPE